MLLSKRKFVFFFFLDLSTVSSFNSSFKKRLPNKKSNFFFKFNLISVIPKERSRVEFGYNERSLQPVRKSVGCNRLKTVTHFNRETGK